MSPARFSKLEVGTASCIGSTMYGGNARWQGGTDKRQEACVKLDGQQTSSWSAIARKKQLPSDATSLTRNPSAASSAARPSPFHDAAHLPRQLCGSHLKMLQGDGVEDSDAHWSL